MSRAGAVAATVHAEYQRLSALGPQGHPKVGALIRLGGENESREVVHREKMSTPGLFGVEYTTHVLDDGRSVVLKGKGRHRATYGIPFIDESVLGAKRHLVKHDDARKMHERKADYAINQAMERGSIRAEQELKMANFNERATKLGLTVDALKGGAKRRRKNSTRRRRRRTARKKTRQRKPKRTLSKRKKSRGTRRRNR